VQQACIDRGLFTRIVGDSLLFAPPLVISADETDQMVQIVGESIAAVQERDLSNQSAIVD
jgi:adenosylmethionine-8-amino-7-oxononanoate aminotransferase